MFEDNGDEPLAGGSSDSSRTDNEGKKVSIHISEATPESIPIISSSNSTNS